MWPSPGASWAANKAANTDVRFSAEATLQAAFTPFGTIQNIKLIKEKGVSRSGGQPAAYWLAAGWARFCVCCRAAGQLACCRRSLCAICGFSLPCAAPGAPYYQRPRSTASSIAAAGDKWQVPVQASWRLAINAQRFCHTTIPV